MWKQIAEWSAQGVVHAVVAAVIAAIIGVSITVWNLMDMETLRLIAYLVVIFFCIFFGLRLLYLPNFKFLTQAEYDALRVLRKVKKRAIYNIMEEKDPKVNDGDR